MTRYAYFNNGFFHSMEGNAFQLHGRFNVENIEVNKSNFRNIAAKIGVPYSYLASKMAKRDYVKDLDGFTVCFFDIETGDDEKFLFGYANEHKFEDPETLLMYMKGFDVIVGFNSFRFDYEVLFKYCPAYFDTIDFSGFKLHVMSSKINIDALFYYQWWKPYGESHRLTRLAEEIGFQRMHDDLEDKDKKCQEDVAILVGFWDTIKELYKFFAIFNMDHITYSTVPTHAFGKLRKWMMQIWMIDNNIYPGLINENSSEKPEFFRYASKGLHRNVRSFDVKSAYPTTAINLGIGLYKERDFSEYMAWLLIQREKYSDIQQTIKFVQNATIGDLGSTNSLIFKRQIMVSIWNDFYNKMLDWTKQIKKKNIVYGYTDNVVTSLQAVPAIVGYTVVKKTEYKWLVIYNEVRILGLTTEGKIQRVQFTKPMRNLLFWQILESRIDEELCGPDFIGFLKDPAKFIFSVVETMKPDMFKIVIRKTDDICRNVEYYDIWDDLQLGFNEFYFTKTGITFKAEAMDLGAYTKKLNLKGYAKLYKSSSRRGFMDERILQGKRKSYPDTRKVREKKKDVVR